METPSTIPLSLYSGDTALWRVSLTSFSADQGWALSYVFNGPQKITVSAAADGADHLVEVAPETTGQWLAGGYSWIARASKDGQIFTVGKGLIEILQDPASVDQVDSRPHCKKVLDAIEAVIEGRAEHDELKTEINGRTLERTPVLQLLALRNTYANEWKQYQNAAAGRKSQTIKVGFPCR